MNLPLLVQVLQLAAIAVLLVLGMSVGGFVERRHFRSLAKREDALRHLAINDLSALPANCLKEPCELVVGQVVIATDYFKTFVANIKKIFGGELRSFDSLMVRARRESLLRMMESAQRLGADRVINVRFSTSTIGSARGKRFAAMVEMIAYGTALKSSDSAPITPRPMS